MSFKKRFSKALGNIIRSHHMNRAIAKGARICDIYLLYYWNQKYWNMERNGELLLLRTLASSSSFRNSSPEPMIIFDVGSNKGDYVKTIRSVITNSVIHCFEIVPHTRETLLENLSAMEDIIVSESGLSNKEGHLEIGYNYENDSQARVVSSLTQAKEIISCKVQTGDNYIAQNGIEEIDLLKIDTEGHEVPVLEGFDHALRDARVRAIQFEYGTTWIAPRHFMYEAYAILEPAGFVIGRLYPDGVFFKPYNRREDEHLRMGNYVAIHETDMPLINALNLNPTRYC